MTKNNRYNFGSHSMMNLANSGGKLPPSSQNLNATGGFVQVKDILKQPDYLLGLVERWKGYNLWK